MADDRVEESLELTSSTLVERVIVPLTVDARIDSRAAQV